MTPVFKAYQIRAGDVRFGSKADIGLTAADVRFTPKADIAEQGHHVRFVPKAEVAQCSTKLKPGHYVRATAMFEVMLALTFPSLSSGARCAPMAAFNLRCCPVGNVARDGASGVASRALAA
jgi:hypothetical protein